VFQGLTSIELATVQGKFTEVGDQERTPFTLAYSVTGHPLDISVFRPFYRPAFVNKYGGDRSAARTFAVSSQEAGALLDSIATIPAVTDGGIDGYLSFALSVEKHDTVLVFESIIDTTASRSLLAKFIDVLSSNSAARELVTAYACQMGMLVGPRATDVTDQVMIRLRGFRKDRRTGEYVGSVRITNTSPGSITGPISFVFRPGENVSLVSPDGFTCAVWPEGAPYKTVLPGILMKDKHADLELRFNNPDADPIELLHQRVLGGPGWR